MDTFRRGPSGGKADHSHASYAVGAVSGYAVPTTLREPHEIRRSFDPGTDDLAEGIVAGYHQGFEEDEPVISNCRWNRRDPPDANDSRSQILSTICTNARRILDGTCLLRSISLDSLSAFVKELNRWKYFIDER